MTHTPANQSRPFPDYVPPRAHIAQANVFPTTEARGPQARKHATRADILDTAKQYVTKDRAATHGDAENTFAAIASLWSSYLGEEIGCADVSAMMILLKLARMKGNPTNDENWIDIAGYAACGGEIATGGGK